MSRPEGWEVDYLSRVRLRIVNLSKTDEEALNHIEAMLEEITGVPKGTCEWYESSPQEPISDETISTMLRCCANWCACIPP